MSPTDGVAVLGIGNRRRRKRAAKPGLVNQETEMADFGEKGDGIYEKFSNYGYYGLESKVSWLG